MRGACQFALYYLRALETVHIFPCSVIALLCCRRRAPSSLVCFSALRS